MSDTKTYKLRTLADVYRLVPSDKIQECLLEIGIVLGAMKAIAEASDPDDVSKLHIQEEFEWVDDGKGELGVQIRTMTDTPVANIEIAPKFEVTTFPEAK